jgi:hypothetical protein
LRELDCRARLADRIPLTRKLPSRKTLSVLHDTERTSNPRALRRLVSHETATGNGTTLHVPACHRRLTVANTWSVQLCVRSTARHPRRVLVANPRPSSAGGPVTGAIGSPDAGVV